MKKLLLLILILALSSCHLFACQYNVRETGFAELQQDRYTVFVFLENSHLGEQKAVEGVADETLRDGNVDLEIVPVQRQNEETVQQLRKWQVDTFPAFVLISPDGQHLLLPSLNFGPRFEEQWSALLNDILSSPVRRALVDGAVRNYGVVLLIEGPNRKENKKARREIKSALESIARKMDFFPKPIKHPPVMAVLPHHSLKEEKYLLWSLGLTAKDVSHPIAAVIYGRARWLGPLFHGEEISRRHLADLLLVIGMDCECGLDKSWLQGTALPVAWDEKVQQKVVDNIGIDPENPLVRREMNRIMRQGVVAANIVAGDAAANPVPQVVDDFEKSQMAADGREALRPFFRSVPSYLLLSLVVIVLAGGGLILVFGRRRF